MKTAKIENVRVLNSLALPLSCTAFLLARALYNMLDSGRGKVLLTSRVEEGLAHALRGGPEQV